MSNTSVIPSLTVSDLFTPASSGVGSNGAVPLSPASGTWLYIQLQIANTVQLPTTAWQSGGVEREIFAIEAVCFSQTDALISAFAQSAFLSSAASGTVTYQALNGQTITTPVTPDPSNLAQNPTGALGWLDLTGQNVYQVSRNLTTYAAGPLAIVNTSSNTIGPYAVGNYHVSNVNTGATYSNLAALSVPTGVIPANGGVITAIAVGLTSTQFTTQAAHGLSVNSSVYLLVPAASGIAGLTGVFALVTSVPSTTRFFVARGSSGTYSGSGGLAYSCTVANMQADVIGIASNAVLGAVTNAITSAPGMLISNLVSWSAEPYESNAAYAARCVLSLAASSPNGPNQAYVYTALSAQQLLPNYVFTAGAITAANTYADTFTGVVTTVVASATPASTTAGANVTPGCSQNLVTGVTNANPCVVSCAFSTGLIAGQTMGVNITGILGTTIANGAFTGTYVTADSFSIPIDTTAAPAYVAGGSVEGGDLGQVDQLIQTRVVPDNTTALTVSALAQPLNVVATVQVPKVYVSAYTLAAPISLQAYVSSLPLGGVVSASETVPISYSEVVSALVDAGVLTIGGATYVLGSPAITVNGGTSDIAFTSNLYQAILATFTLSVVGV